MNLKTRLNAEIERLSSKLETLEPGTKEYNDVADARNKSMNQLVEIEKVEKEHKSRTGKILVDFTLGIAGLGLTAAGTLLAYTFEEKGTISSKIGQMFMNKLIKK